jgi:nucleoside-diphosphate-sugar epimerase
VTHPLRILVLGASGRLGRMLQRHLHEADLHPIWQFRAPPGDALLRGQILVFDPLSEPPVSAPVDLVIGLAGIVPGKGELSLNVDLGLAAVHCAIALKAQHVMLASSAAVYGASTKPFFEEDATYPLSPYGMAKLEMEEKALGLAQRNGLPATMLRIGNVAGADALLGQDGKRRNLDQFPSGHGPIRSYIGPQGLSAVLASLIRCACAGIPLPERLNVALRGGVPMADLCKAAGLDVTWQPAPQTAVETVVLDVTRLADLISVRDADAQAIVADWAADMGA